VPDKFSSHGHCIEIETHIVSRHKEEMERQVIRCAIKDHFIDSFLLSMLFNKLCTRNQRECIDSSLLFLFHSEMATHLLNMHVGIHSRFIQNESRNEVLKQTLDEFIARGVIEKLIERL